MAKLGVEQAVGDALETYYHITGANPPVEIADYSSAQPAAGTVLQPGEKVTLPAPKATPKA